MCPILSTVQQQWYCSCRDGQFSRSGAAGQQQQQQQKYKEAETAVGMACSCEKQQQGAEVLHGGTITDTIIGVVCRPVFISVIVAFPPQVFVDEFTCIGCRNCCNVCPKTFDIEDDWGRARVMKQGVDVPDKLQVMGGQWAVGHHLY